MTSNTIAEPVDGNETPVRTAPKWVWVVEWGDEGTADVTTHVYVNQEDAGEAYDCSAREQWAIFNEDGDDEDEDEQESEEEPCSQALTYAEPEDLWFRLLMDHGYWCR